MFQDARKRLWMLAVTKRSRTKRFTLTVPEEMASRLEEERKKRLLDTIPETVRVTLNEYLRRS